MNCNNIKKISLLLFVFLLVCMFYNTWADEPTTIHTPMGSEVSNTWILDEFSQTTIEYWTEYFSDLYPDADVLGLASRTYNCHAFTFHTSEGGNRVWIGVDYWWAEDIYWQDGSYLEETAQTLGQKVSYLPDYQANHSGVTTSLADNFISKWGEGPLMEHSYDYCPFYYQGETTFKYYRRAQNPITLLEINPFINRQPYFFKYEPEVLSKIVSMERSDNFKKEGVVK